MARKIIKEEEVEAVITVELCKNKNKVSISGFEKLTSGRIERAFNDVLAEYGLLKRQAIAKATSEDRKRQELEKEEEHANG